MNLEVALQPQLIAVRAYGGYGSNDFRILFDIKEITRAQVSITLSVSCVDRVRGDDDLSGYFIVNWHDAGTVNLGELTSNFNESPHCSVSDEHRASSRIQQPTAGRANNTYRRYLFLTHPVSFDG